MILDPSQAEKEYITVMEVSLGDTIIYYYLPNFFNKTKGKTMNTCKHIE